MPKFSTVPSARTTQYPGGRGGAGLVVVVVVLLFALTVVLAWATVVRVVVRVAVPVVLPAAAVVEAEGWVVLVVAVDVLDVPYALCMPIAPKKVTRHTTQLARRPPRPAPRLKTGPQPGARRTLKPSSSDNALFQRIAHPRDDLVQHVFERGGRLETKHPLGFLYGGDPLGDVMFEGRVADVMEGHF